jgi:hypothetical protein
MMPGVARRSGIPRSGRAPVDAEEALFRRPERPALKLMRGLGSRTVVIPYTDYRTALVNKAPRRPTKEARVRVVGLFVYLFLVYVKVGDMAYR